MADGMPVRGGAGHAERGHRRDGVAIQVADVSFDEQDLADVRERQILRRGQHLDGAGGDPAMPAVSGRVRGRCLMPGQRIQRIEQGFAVLLHRQDELPASLADELSGGLHRM